MQEYWFCSRCKSMNRSAASVCYSCKATKADNTFATQVERQEGAVLTPGLDEEHRAVAWTLMAGRTYVSSWRLGYLAAALLVASMPITLVLGFVASRFVLESGDRMAYFQRSTGYPFLIACLLFFLVAIIVHSAFLGLASMDAAALGSGSPRFGAVRAAVWWIESYLWALRGGLAFVVPPLLTLGALISGGLIFGLIMGFAWMACALVVLGDPIRSLARPARLLSDLYVRSAVKGSSDSRVVSWWALAWGTAQGITYAVSALTYVLIVLLIFAAMTGMDVASFFETDPGSGSQTAQMLLVLLIGLSQAVAQAISFVLLAVITYEIATRQRIREAWVRSGATGEPNPIWPGGPGQPQAPTPDNLGSWQSPRG